MYFKATRRKPLAMIMSRILPAWPAAIAFDKDDVLYIADTQSHRIRRFDARTGAVETVALSGGCFQSALLTERTRIRLERDGFEVLVHRLVPPSDGGLALGQAAVAAYRAILAPEGGSRHVSRNTG